MSKSEFPDTRLGQPPRKNEEERKLFFKKFLLDYQPALFSFLVKVMKLDEELADEISQAFIVDRVLNEKVFSLVDGKRRFRNILTTCLKNYYIDYYRKRKPKTGIETPEAQTIPEIQDSLLDKPWADAVLQVVLNQFQKSCEADNKPELWQLFVGRVMSNPKVSYRHLVQSLDLESPAQASNLLMTAKRRFNRIVEDFLVDQNIQYDGESSGILADQEVLKNELASRGFRDIAKTSEQTRGPSVFQSSYGPVLEELKNFESNDDLHEMVEHLLTNNFRLYLEDQFQVDDSWEKYFSVADVIDADDAPFELMRALKDSFKVIAKDLSSPMPSSLNVFMTILLIAKSLTVSSFRFQEVTGMRIDRALAGLDHYLEQTWVPAKLKSLLMEAKEIAMNL